MKIPSGHWQRITGLAFLTFGLFAALASTPYNSASAVAALCFAIGGSLLFWGIILRYFYALDQRLDRIEQAIRPDDS